MVDYNKQRKEAMSLIDTFASKGKFTTDAIAFHVSRQTGFSDNFTRKYIEKCLEQKFFFKTPDEVITSNEVSAE